MASSTKQLYLFLTACSGNWRNTIHISCQGETDDLVEFPTCEKVKQMKLFKNNRVDLKFHSPQFAEQFVSKYLGAAC